MKTSFYLLCGSLLFLFISKIGFTQKVSNLLNELPIGLKLDKTIVQTYQMTTNYIDYDLKGNFIKKMQINGIYTCGLNSDSVKWNNVTIAHSKTQADNFHEEKPQQFMENFTYVPSAGILNASFFEKIPQAEIYHKNLIWDMVGIEGFAYWYWDSLKINTEYLAREINTKIDLAGEGTFENKDIRITWLGITKRNNEICAIIKYATMNNPLSIELEYLSMTGRSHYWGEVYVSLKDKQIEYATLSEDVITDVKFANQSTNSLGYTVRNIKLEKIK